MTSDMNDGLAQVLTEMPVLGLVEVNRFFLECYDAAPDVAKDHLVALLVGRVYKEAPPSLRVRIIDHLVRPMGILSAMVVANGVFSRFRLRAGHDSAPGGMDTVQTIQGSDVVVLVDFVQQISYDCIDALSGLLSSEAGLLSTVAAAILLTVLGKRSSKPSPRSPTLDS